MSEPTVPTPPEDAVPAAPAAPPQAETTAPEPALQADTAPVPAEAAATADPAADPAADSAPDEAAPASDVAAEAAAEPEPGAKPARPSVPELSPAAVAKALAQHFPLLFAAPRALPLKLRIQADIQTRAPGVFTKKALSIFLHRHTTSTAYLRALVNIATRHDLDGQPAGEVAEEHRVAATAEVERRRGIVDARRMAERDAQRLAYREAARAARGTGPAAGAGAAPGADGSPEGAAALPADGAPATPRPPRPPRPDRPDRPDRAPRGDRPPRADRAPQAGQPPRGDRPPRPDRPQRPPRADRPPLAEGAAPAAHEGTPPAAQEAREPRPPREPREPRAPQGPQYNAAELEARRDRAALLRAYEGSTLTRANFCVLKRIPEAELETRLVQARAEREERGPDPRQQERRDERATPRPEGGPRREGERPQGGARDFGAPRDGRDSRGPRRDAPRAPLPAGERTRPAGSGAAATAPKPQHKPPQKPGR
jgi:ProP effector